MGFLKNLFGGNANMPTYDIEKAKETALWQQGQARYNVNNGFGGIQWDPTTNTQNITYTPQMQSVFGNLFGGTNADKKAEQAAYNSWADKNEPLFDRQASKLQDQLANQGIPVGSEAYSRAMADLSRDQNDARAQAQNQAYLTGQQARNNEISNNLSIFSAFNPLNGYQPGAGTPTTDIYGNAYQSQVNAYQYNQQAKQNMAKGLVDLGGSALNLAGGFLFSDARIKENLRPVGQLFNGLTIYAFNFPGEDITRIGLVAQEVEQVLPQAVKESEEGLLMVDYGLATQFEEDDEQGEE